MERYQLEELEIIFDCAGRDDWGKFSFPVWYGIPVKMNWREYRYDFNLRGGLKKVSGAPRVWPDPQEVLKRTDGNDLIYYGTHGYESSYDLIKNYYVPFNGIYDCDLFVEKPLEGRPVRQALDSFDKLTIEAGRLAAAAVCDRPREFLQRVAVRNRERLVEEAMTLHRIMGANLPVLPPETIDVDYEVIPLILTEGCTYNCRFCLFKTTGGFRVRSPQNIAAQIRSLKDFYGADLINYNSLMLGQNNALAAGEDLLAGAAEMAYELLNLSASYHRGRPNLFMFGSVDSFLEADDSLLDRLERLPYRTLINVGMESFDQETLDRLGKPLQAEQVREAFRKMQAVNRCRSNIAVSCNFVLGGDLPSRHLEAIKTVLAAETTARDRGTVYLSPLIGTSRRREILKEFREIKMSSPLPVFIYLAQRL
ncbi:MAG: radical SAM protein [Deltaproteobacteria bacterium]|nr:radical SAM protein [Deltaproteobacteria bacterium]